MSDKTYVLERVADISSRARAFTQMESSSVDSIIAITTSAIISSISRAKLDAFPGNSESVSEVLAAFESLHESNYFANILAFVGDFSEQVDAFKRIYSSDNPESSILTAVLPSIQLTSEDHEVLSDQAASSVSVFEGPRFQIRHELNSLLSRSMGDKNIPDLISRSSDIIRKLSNVEPLAKDQLILFFRVVAFLSYKRIEESGTKLSYSYVGPVGKNTRRFCLDVMSKEKFTFEEMQRFDNGQVGNAAINAGGYMCQHWWYAEDLA